jgi:Flp pilus assembly CpaF family ATPase
MSDLKDLPIFGANGGVAGRQRSGFQLGTDGAPVPRSSPVPAPAPTLPPHPVLRPVPAGTQAVASVVAQRPILQNRLEDWGLVGRFRQQVAARLADMQGEAAWTREAEVVEGRKVIAAVLDDDASERLARQGSVRSAAERELLAQAIFDSMFGLGRLQRLVDDRRIENILISGCDEVVVEWYDGTMHRMPPVADSDEELLSFLEHLASRADNPRTFTPSSPSLHMTLPDGSRLAAARDTSRPSVVIRRHRVREVTLAQLVEMGTLTSVMADFLGAAVRAGLSVVISGQQGAGKTVTLRAMCGAIPAGVVIGTFESEFELFLKKMLAGRNTVWEWESRIGSGEEGFGGRSAGARDTPEQVTDSFRFRIDRQILGEVRGPEVWSMIKLMESGKGSMSTTHARSAGTAIDKLISCAMEAGPQISPAVAAKKLTQTVDLVVQMREQVVAELGPEGQIGRKNRYVDEIVQVLPGEGSAGFSTPAVFRRVPGRCAVAAAPPDGLIEDLVAAGWDRAAFGREMASEMQGVL